uniref:Uncharacterized protein n=1 Tax=Anguilla anguilla TaxID=7936 RepID=A0A0E9UTH4_ANGAN
MLPHYLLIFSFSRQPLYKAMYIGHVFAYYALTKQSCDLLETAWTNIKQKTDRD